MVLEKVLFLSEGYNEKNFIQVLNSFKASDNFLIATFNKSQIDQFQRFGVKTFTYKEMAGLLKQHSMDLIIIFGWFLLKTFFADIKRYFGKTKIILMLEQIDYREQVEILGKQDLKMGIAEYEMKKNEQLYFYGLADQIVVFNQKDLDELSKTLDPDKVILFDYLEKKE